MSHQQASARHAARPEAVARAFFEELSELKALSEGGPEPDEVPPRPLVRETPLAADYPVDALGPLRAAVLAVHGRTQAPVAIPAGSALAAASLAVQGHADVETLGGPRPLSLYVVTIAASGERKSTVDALILEEVRRFEKEREQARRAAFERWLRKHAIWKTERERILARVKKGKGEQRGAAEAELEALGPEPAAPPSEARICAEPTYEGLVRFYMAGQPSAGLFSDEGGQFLGGHAMNAENRQKTMAAFNALWMGDPIRRTRAGDGHVTLHGRRLAMHLMVQPMAAAALLADPLAADLGFLARCLICEPRSTIGTRLHENARFDPEALDAFAERLREILEAPLPMDPETGELRPRLLRLSDPARQMVVEFSDTIEKAQAPGGPLEHVRAAASKAAEQACRIAGVRTLVRDLNAEEVDLDAMSGGIELAQYYLGEAARLAEAAAVSTEIDRAERLRRWLLDAWPHREILLSEVVQRAPIRALRESPAARAALRLLEQHGWLVPLDPGTVVRGKPRKEAWRIIRGAVA